MLLIDALQYSKPSRERYEEWRRAGLGAVHVTVATWEDAKETLREIGRWNARLRAHGDLIRAVRDPADIQDAVTTDRTGVILGFQNTSPFEDDLDLVGAFQEAGVRIAQLTYNTQNSVGCGCWERESTGLSSTYGRNLIREMNAVGMLVDVSHCNDRTCLEALEASEKPIALTHANPRSFVGEDVELRFRNKADDTIVAIAQAGGVVGLSMYPRLAPGGHSCTLELFCDMVMWTAEKIGVEHVGFGSDFYIGQDEEAVLWWRQGRWSRSPLIPIAGNAEFPAWFEHGLGFTRVIDRLRERGVSESELSLLAGGNWSRLFAETFTAQPHRPDVDGPAGRLAGVPGPRPVTGSIR
jgi:microsomal dipeptidase-like Zn-dependent dipeptidase